MANILSLILFLVVGTVLTVTMTLSIFVYITFLSAEVIQPPTDTVVHAGETAIFTCDVGDAPSASWKVNDEYAHDSSSTIWADISLDFVEANNTHVLAILAKPEYDMTKVQCVAVDESERVDSEAAYLYIS